MKRITAIVAIIVLGLAVMAKAETSVKAEVDKTTITTDEDLTYKLIISTDEKNIPQPQIPKFEGFNVLSSAQTSGIKFAGGVQKIGAVFVFILTPADVGKFKIEPSTIKVKNKVYATDSFEIEVTQGKTKPQPKQQEKLIPESEEPQYTL